MLLKIYGNIADAFMESDHFLPMSSRFWNFVFLLGTLL
jgi:hypothetical protein